MQNENASVSKKRDYLGNCKGSPHKMFAYLLILVPLLLKDKVYTAEMGIWCMAEADKLAGREFEM